MRAFKAPSEARPGRRKTPLTERREARFRFASEGDAPLEARLGRLRQPPTEHDRKCSAFPGAPLPSWGRCGNYGVPGAAKNTGDVAWAI